MSPAAPSATSAGTVREALEAATDAIAAAGSDSPRLDAELLLAEAVGGDRTSLALSPEASVAAAAARIFAAAVRRRVAREPVAYILGRRGFRRLELAVDPRALIPRPETELLVEAALELVGHGRPGTEGPGSEVPEGPGTEVPAILDVGTGSGAVALAIADELPSAEVVATDLSPDAVELARENAARLGLGERVRIEHGSFPPGGRFDLVVANLPYVSEAEWRALQPEITHHEPHEALVAGPTGLEAIEELLGRIALGDCAAAVALEVGAGQAAAVADMVRRAGYERVETRPDLAGIDRVVVGHGFRLGA